MTDAEKKAALATLDAPCRRLSSEKFKEWMRLTAFYGTFGQGIPPSHAAIELGLKILEVDKLTAEEQLKVAIETLRVQGFKINEVLTELGR